MNEPPLYLDHAATSWPKPAGVKDSILRFMSDVAANAGRSGHTASVHSARMVFETREKLAKLVGAPNSEDLVFTRGTTESVNLVLKGFLRPNDLVLVSPLEHNAVMRPLRRLQAERKIRVQVLAADAWGRIDPGLARSQAEQAPRLLVLAHVSNVNGAVQDLAAIRRVFPETPLLLDAAQSAGVLPIDVAGQRIDFLACSAHKALLGPTGVGLCYLDPAHEVRPLVEGGTGSRSEQTEQPAFRPDRYESGTLNLHGIAGLQGALAYIEANGPQAQHKRRLTGLLLEGLAQIPGVQLHAPRDGTAMLAAFSVDGLAPDAVAAQLERAHGVLCRPGLQCAPAAHRHLGTFPQGTVRLSPGYANTDTQIRQAVAGVRAIVER